MHNNDYDCGIIISININVLIDSDAMDNLCRKTDYKILLIIMSTYEYQLNNISAKRLTTCQNGKKLGEAL